jgi:hypothetical protein
MAASDDKDPKLAAPPSEKEEEIDPEEHSTDELIEAIKKKMAGMKEYET